MYNFKQICRKQYSKESESLLGVFSAMGNAIIDIPFEIKQVKSASIFPEVVTDSDKYVIYWDMQYWEFFDSFLLELLYLLENNTYFDSFINRVCSICFDYLSLRLVHIPALAYCIQVNRERRFGTETAYQPVNNLGEKKIIGSAYEKNKFLSRILVFNHELFHLYYQLTPDKKLADYDMLHRLADLYMNGDWTHFKADCEEYKMLFGSLQQLQNFSFDKLMEEAACDFRALAETVLIQNRIDSETKRNLQLQIREIHDAFHINQTFLSCLCTISSCWEIVYKAYISGNSTEEVLKIMQPSLEKINQMLAVRNKIIPDFLDRAIMQEHGISSYTNIIGNSFVRSVFQKITDIMLDGNFMVYAIEETLKLRQLPHYNPIELKYIVLGNAGYQ